MGKDEKKIKTLEDDDLANLGGNQRHYINKALIFVAWTVEWLSHNLNFTTTVFSSTGGMWFLLCTVKLGSWASLLKVTQVVSSKDTGQKFALEFKGHACWQLQKLGSPTTDRFKAITLWVVCFRQGKGRLSLLMSLGLMLMTFRKRSHWPTLR